MFDPLSRGKGARRMMCVLASAPVILPAQRWGPQHQAAQPDMEVRIWRWRSPLVPPQAPPLPHPGMPSCPAQKPCNAGDWYNYHLPACITASKRCGAGADLKLAVKPSLRQWSHFTVPSWQRQGWYACSAWFKLVGLGPKLFQIYERSKLINWIYPH